MKKRLLLLSALFITVIFFNACQKEVSIEAGGVVSQGSLQLDSGSGDCLPKTVSGVYEVAKALNAASNYIDVQVNVTQSGSYLIYTDTTNGYYFRASGVFTSTGMNTVRLKGNGTPLAAGIDNFLVTYGASACFVSVTVVPVGGGTPAQYTLAGAPATCTGVAGTITGTYVAGVPLTIANSVLINVNVTATGTYSITTTASNGIVFSGTGSLTATGAQTIKLTASGTPGIAGPTTIPVSNGAASMCNFTLTVAPGTVVAGDYFPLTQNSWWSYDDLDGLFYGGDSLTRVNINPITIAGNVYRVFQNQENITTQDSSFYRKVGTEYREITIADLYTGALTFDDPGVIGEIPFLKEGLATGNTWESPQYSGTVSAVPVKLKYVFTCTDANATVSYNGNTFTNVYKISWRPQFSVSGSPFQDEVVTYDSYYAKGVGLIYWKATDIGGGGSAEIKIRHWQVF